MEIIKRIKLALRPKWAAAVHLKKEEWITISPFAQTLKTTNRLILWWGHPEKNISVEDTARKSIAQNPENEGFIIDEVIARRII